jgi:hypothetical protein
MFFKKSILAPFTTTQTLKILHIRKSGSNTEGPTRALRGNLFSNWDLDSDDNSTADDLGADPDLDVMAACDSAPADVESTSSGRKPPRITHSTASLESFNNIAKISRLPGGLLQFVNWAFRPDSIPALQVLAFGNFSYSSRFYNYNHLFSRHT